MSIYSDLRVYRVTNRVDYFASLRCLARAVDNPSHKRVLRRLLGAGVDNPSDVRVLRGLLGGRVEDGIYDSYGRRTIMRAIKAKQETGDSIRLAINSNDSGKLTELIMENYHCYPVLRYKIDDLFVKMDCEPTIALLDCGHVEYIGDIYNHTNGQSYCSECSDADFVTLQDTDELCLTDDAYCHTDGNYYSYEEPEDEQEDEPEYQSGLMSYSENVLRHCSPDANIKSSPAGDFLMGVEFEMVCTSGDSDGAETARSKLGSNYCIAKSDGSLPDGGFEIVTAPRGLAEHVKRFGAWGLDIDNYSAWATDKCGLHVHVDQNAFTKLSLGKFICFINNPDNAGLIQRVAGRHYSTSEQARCYCASESSATIINPAKAIKGKRLDRYLMVNTRNLTSRQSARLGLSPQGGEIGTVELRIFKASLKTARILSQLEFTHAVVCFCRHASICGLTTRHFTDWLELNHYTYPNLAVFLGLRTKKTAPSKTAAVS